MENWKTLKEKGAHHQQSQLRLWVTGISWVKECHNLGGPGKDGGIIRRGTAWVKGRVGK